MAPPASTSATLLGLVRRRAGSTLRSTVMPRFSIHCFWKPAIQALLGRVRAELRRSAAWAQRGRHGWERAIGGPRREGGWHRPSDEHPAGLFSCRESFVIPRGYARSNP